MTQLGATRLVVPDADLSTSRTTEGHLGLGLRPPPGAGRAGGGGGLRRRAGRALHVRPRRPRPRGQPAPGRPGHDPLRGARHTTRPAGRGRRAAGRLGADKAFDSALLAGLATNPGVRATTLNGYFFAGPARRRPVAALAASASRAARARCCPPPWPATSPPRACASRRSTPRCAAPLRSDLPRPTTCCSPPSPADLASAGMASGVDARSSGRSTASSRQVAAGHPADGHPHGPHRPHPDDHPLLGPVHGGGHACAERRAASCSPRQHPHG